MHDALIKAIETPEAQQSDNLADAIHRQMFPDGRPMLVALHAEGMLKKIQTETVVVTPTTTASCKLSELNDILRQMKEGKQAVDKLAELDASAGISGKAKVRDGLGRELRSPPAARTNLAGSNQVLTDDALATNLRQQAERMSAEAKSLLAESARLMEEAAIMAGAPTKPAKPKKTTKSKVADAAQS
jgi:predicted nucleic acid-binding Zn ribbon protein